MAAYVLIVLLGGKWLVEAYIARQQDFFVYDDAGGVFLAGGDIYALPGLPYTYPPLLAIVMAPLSLLPGWLAAGLWLAAMSVLSVALCRRLFAGHEWWVLGLALLSAPIGRSLYLGQLNPVVFALMFPLLVSHRYAGPLLGLAAGLKLTPAYLGQVFLLRRSWRAALGTVAGFAGTVALGWLIAPAASRHYWLGLIADSGRVGDVDYADNQSILGMVCRTAGVTHPGLGLTLGAAGAALVLTWAAAFRARDADVVVQVTIFGLGAALASPVSWSHHWIWLLVMASVLLREGHRRAGLAVLLVSCGEPVLLRHLPVPLASSTFALTGIALLLGLAIRGSRLAGRMPA